MKCLIGLTGITIALCTCACDAALSEDGVWLINSTTDFWGLFNAENGTFASQSIRLVADIDFGGEPAQPLGITNNGSCVAFSGTFDGGSFSIRGLVINNATSTSVGLFCAMENATVKNMTIEESSKFVGHTVGSVCANASGSIVITDVVAKATVQCNHYCGGIVGYCAGNNTSLVLQNCDTFGSVTGRAETTAGVNAGGFVGYVGNIQSLELTYLVNKADVTCKPSECCNASGFTGLSYCTNTKYSYSLNEGDVNRVTDDESTADTIFVLFGQPANVNVTQCYGKTFGAVVLKAQDQLGTSGTDVNLTGYHIVDRENHKEVSGDIFVWNIMDVMLCHVVIVVFEETNQSEFVEHGKSMSTNQFLENLMINSGEGARCTATVTGETVDCAGSVVSDIVVDFPNLSSQNWYSSSLSSSIASSSVTTVNSTFNIEITLSSSVAAGSLDKEQIKTALQSIVDVNNAVIAEVMFAENDQGSIIVVVSVDCNSCTATAVVNIIKDNLQGDGCSAGVLCQATDVFIQGQEDKPSLANRLTRCLMFWLVFLQIFACRIRLHFT